MDITQDIQTKETLTHDAGLDISGRRLCGGGESASSPLVGFGELNDYTIKGLTSLLSVNKKLS
jgi:hypothetical protein